eukprot:CAMPEP_0171451924 /NCGR_PEP_ID=MMETSP0945-20130129/234_1 /TAXON_ID=109269 /ORGANISM="Vaucheria litorea, Strain CCMP2940" /LENGTH=645 /DNA_ID=CAMNT_0011976481 /DNA_START=330 /DNA_END=2267 /DNA_ORIENTATION=+
MINDRYMMSKKLGGGSFGDIYLGIDAHGGKVAMKFEKCSSRCPQLRHEYKVYRELQNFPGISRVYYFGTQNVHHVMVMDLLGPSLEDLFTKCGRRFSLKTVLQIADQLLERMETMHNRHLIHRDVKPGNFCIGAERGSSTIYTIDFGLSTRYRHPQVLQHIPYREGRSLTGTPRYASINNHLGYEQSRRDDLESIGYVLVYFLKGSLPWQGLKARTAKKKYKLIMERKQMVSIQQLCSNLPLQFAEYLAYCRSLKFEAKPNISYLRSLFRELYRNYNFDANLEGSNEWDWNKCHIGEAIREESSQREREKIKAIKNLPERPSTAVQSNKMNIGQDINVSLQGATQHATIGTLGRSSTAIGGYGVDPIQDEIAGRLNAIASFNEISPQQRGQHPEADHHPYVQNKDYLGSGILRSPQREEQQHASTNHAKSARPSSNGIGSSSGWGMWNLRAKSNGNSFWGSNAPGGSNLKSVNRTESNVQNGGAGIRPVTAPNRKSAASSEGWNSSAVTGSRGVMRYRDSSQSKSGKQGVAPALGTQANHGGWVSPDVSGRPGVITASSSAFRINGTRPSTGGVVYPGRSSANDSNGGNPFASKEHSQTTPSNDSGGGVRLRSSRPMSAKKGLNVSSSRKKFIRQPAQYITGKKY